MKLVLLTVVFLCIALKMHCIDTHYTEQAFPDTKIFFI